MTPTARRIAYLRGLMIAAAIGASSGCTSPIPTVDDRLLSVAQSQGASADQVRHGHELLVTACAYCHVPVQPNSISWERWEKALPRMIEKAQLAAANEADIRAYVLAARALPPAAASTH